MSRVNEVGEWRSGLTWRVVLAIIYGAVVLMPVTIWGSLMIGSVPRLTWVVVILFYWLSLLYGKPLTKQEILVMFASTATAIYASGTLNFSSMFYRVWFANSPIAYSYGLTKYLPDWWVPKNPLILSQTVRTFFDPSWIPVISVSTFFWVLNVIIGVSLGFLFYQLFVEVEKLPFPMARVSVEVITELVEREPNKMRVFVVFALFGFIYSLLAYGVPVISQAVVGYQITLIPYPWLDMTATFQDVLPGSMIGLDTNILNYLMGFILPFNVVVCLFIGSFISSVIGNPMIVWYYPDLIPKWVNFPWGMRLRDIYFWSNVYVWYSVSIGIAFAAFVGYLILERKKLALAIKGLLRLPKHARAVGALSLKTILVIYFSLTTLWFLVVSLFLLPGFPMLPLFFLIVIWPIVDGFIATRTYAETGFTLTIPFFTPNILILTMEAYHIPVHSKLGIWPWFAPLGVSNGEGWCSDFYICKGLRCTFSSYIKAVLLIATPVAIIFNLIYSEYLWHMSPIPSPLFQWAQIYWPIRAAQESLWYTRKIYGLNPTLILYGFVSVLATQLITAYFKIPFSPVGILWGITSPLPTPLATFIGALVFKLLTRILKRSESEIRGYAYLMVGGYSVGLAIAMSIAISIAIFVRALSVLPY